MSSGSIDHFVHSYGDVLYDLCESVLWNSANAQVALRVIFKDIRRGSRGQRYSTHERAWVLRIAYERLRGMTFRHGRQVSLAEQIKLDSSGDVAAKLKQFDIYFHRLSTEDQILLLLRDKYGIPYPEIATAMGVPEDSLKIRRQQSLRALEEWLWDNA